MLYIQMATETAAHMLDNVESVKALAETAKEKCDLYYI